METDPSISAATIADAIWIRARIDPVRPSILRYLEAVRFEIYDTTQGLARDHRSGFQRGKVIATGTIIQGKYVCGTHVYKVAKALEREHGVAPGSLPCRIVLLGHSGCTLAGMRVLIKEAGSRIRTGHNVHNDHTQSITSLHQNDPDTYKDSDTDQLMKRRKESNSFPSQFVHDGRQFIEVLRATASELPRLRRVADHLALRIASVHAGIMRAKLITGPIELLRVSTVFVSTCLVELNLLQERAKHAREAVMNASVAQNILMPRRTRLHGNVDADAGADADGHLVEQLAKHSTDGRTLTLLAREAEHFQGRQHAMDSSLASVAMGDLAETVQDESHALSERLRVDQRLHVVAKY